MASALQLFSDDDFHSDDELVHGVEVESIDEAYPNEDTLNATAGIQISKKN